MVQNISHIFPLISFLNTSVFLAILSVRSVLIHVVIEVAAPHYRLVRIFDLGQRTVRVDPVPVGDAEELLEYLLRRFAVQPLINVQV